MSDLVAESIAVAVAGGIVLMLASLGVLEVIAFMAATRTREIAVRMALGATRLRVVGLMLADVVKLVAPGVAVGLVVGGFDSPAAPCDTADMSVTLTIRLPAVEKARWEQAAAAANESVAEYVRGAVRQRAAASASPWERLIGSADVAVAAPTNPNIRRAFTRRRRRAG